MASHRLWCRPLPETSAAVLAALPALGSAAERVVQRTPWFFQTTLRAAAHQVRWGWGPMTPELLVFLKEAGGQDWPDLLLFCAGKELDGHDQDACPCR